MNTRGISQILLSAVFVFVAVCRAVAMAQQTAPDLPQVPALIVGAGPPAPQSFVVRGFARSSADRGLGFDVAADGRRERCVLYDAADGTPMFISDGHQTLLYDLAENRILRVPTCRGNVRVDWDANAAKPLSFSFNFEFNSDPKKPAARNTWFRINRFVEASAAELKRVEAPAGSVIWAAERKSGGVDSVQDDPADSSWFNFRSLTNGNDYYALELHATAIGRPMPAAELAFPDAAKIAREVPLEEFDLKAKPALIDAFASGRCWAPKLALASDDSDAALKKVLPKVDLKSLREQDARFSARYRAALAAQGINFATLKPAKPSTQPAASKATDLIKESN